MNSPAATNAPHRTSTSLSARPTPSPVRVASRRAARWAPIMLAPVDAASGSLDSSTTPPPLLFAASRRQACPTPPTVDGPTDTTWPGEDYPVWSCSTRSGMPSSLVGDPHAGRHAERPRRISSRRNPACAGTTCWSGAAQDRPPGKPPRVRGRPRQDRRGAGVLGKTPACAGTTLAELQS